MPLMYFAYLLDAAIETWILWFFFDIFLIPSERHQSKIWLVKIGYFLYQLITYFLDFPLFSSAILTYFITIIIAAFFFENELHFSILTIHIFVILSYACRTITFSLFIWFDSAPANSGTLPILSPYMQVFACLLFLLLTRLLVRIKKLRIRGKILPYDLIIAIMPALILLCLAIFIWLEVSQIQNIVLYYACVSSCLFSCSFILFYHLDKLTIINEERLHSRLSSQMLELSKKHYSELIQSQNEYIRMRHDINKHLKALHFMCSQGQTEDASAYLSNLLNQGAIKKQFVKTDNTIIDSLLNQNLPPLKEKGIKLDLSIMIPPKLPYNDIDLCILLSNLLANAQEACDRMSDKNPSRKISLAINQRKSFLFIRIENTYDGELKLLNGQYLSIKRGAETLGIGLYNVREIVDKYSGVITTTHDANHFCVQILLPGPN